MNELIEKVFKCGKIIFVAFILWKFNKKNIFNIIWDEEKRKKFAQISVEREKIKMFGWRVKNEAWNQMTESQNGSL